MTLDEIKQVEDFCKYVMGTKLWISYFNHSPKDRYGYEHWLRLCYWSLPVQNKTINKILVNFK